MANALMGEAEAELGDRTLTFVMNNAAWVQVERLVSKSYLDVIAELINAELSGQSPMLMTTGALVYGATREHHSELTLDECYNLVRLENSAIMAPLGTAIRGSIKTKDDEPGEAAPPRKAAKLKVGTGTKR